MIKIFRATEQDSCEIWRWRNDETSRQMFLNQSEVSWEDHCRWFNDLQHDSSRRLYIATDDVGCKMGVCRFDLDRSSNVAEVSINLNPTMRGKGLASSVLFSAIDQYFLDNNGVTLLARIRSDNLASLRCFKRVGFKQHTADSGNIINLLKHNT